MPESCLSHGISRNTGANKEGTPFTLGLACTESEEVVVLHSSGGSRKDLHMMKSLLNSGVLTRHFKFRTHELNSCS